MSNELSIFDGPKGQIPEYLKKAFEGKSNVGDGIAVPSLSYEGKVWSLHVGGEKRPLIRVNEDGDEEPISTMRVVIVDFNQRRGRTYYEGSYNPDAPGTPICWSKDGVAPDQGVPEDVMNDITAHKCTDCPMAIKGSRITDNGKEVAACGEHRMLAVVPANKLDSQPLRLKIAVTSDFDKNSPELEAKNFFAFKQYRAFLRNHNVTNTAQVVTKMKFDPTVAYPKIVFGPDRVITEEELETLETAHDEDAIRLLLTGFTAEGRDGAPTDNDSARKSLPVADDDDDEDDAAEAKAAAAEAARARVKAKKAADEEEAKAAEEAKAKKAAAAKAKAKAAEEKSNKAPAKVKADAVDAEFDDLGAAFADEPEKAGSGAAVADDDDLSALLSEWDDD